MKVITTDKGGQQHHYDSVEQYVSCSLGNSLSQDRLHCIEEIADSHIQAFGRLLDVLANKGILDAYDIYTIVNLYGHKVDLVSTIQENDDGNNNNNNN